MTDYLLAEDGSRLLAESGDFLILETSGPVVVVAGNVLLGGAEEVGVLADVRLGGIG